MYTIPNNILVLVVQVSLVQYTCTSCTSLTSKGKYLTNDDYKFSLVRRDLKSDQNIYIYYSPDDDVVNLYNQVFIINDGEIISPKNKSNIVFTNQSCFLAQDILLKNACMIFLDINPP